MPVPYLFCSFVAKQQPFDPGSEKNTYEQLKHTESDEDPFS